MQPDLTQLVQRNTPRKADGEISVHSAPHEAQLLQDWLINGKPELGWRGDPRLELRIGILVAAKPGYEEHTGKFFRKGDTVNYRYEVWRHNEDGTDTQVVAKGYNEWEQLIPKLIEMDPRTPGFKPVIETMDAENAVNDKHNSDDFKDHWGAATEHMWRLAQERMHGRLTHRGIPGRNPDKQL